MNFARSFLGTLMRTILVGCILNGCDCSVIVLRRSDFRKPFSIKLLLGELEKKHGMNRKLMTKT